MDEPLKGLIFDIQGHSLHDGPGTRTTVFLKGCPLKCDWCCNPEGIHRYPEMLYYESRCVHCGHCIAACPHGAISVVDGLARHDREKCAHCETHDCVSVCYHEGKCLTGKHYTVDQLMHIFQRDRQFWGGKGGASFSGGEPLLQRHFIREVLRRCKEAMIHTCIETTSHVQPDFYLDVMQYVDWVFTDIKHMDPAAHQARTGVDNARILANIEALAKKPDWDGVLVVRVPVVTGYNDSEENIRATARFIRGIGMDALNLLPFHRLGESKYRQLDQCYPFAEMKPPEDAHMRTLQRAALDEGIYCFIGHETPF